ncbi:FGFR1 [Branchiostoma lanceolatum]|uniref:FGFR1 protein n=1 Tax=Branchiostoma lanceolatum TaxID=7740 RepID=A0A8S4MP68_BRALA|nr:FGFR1 [Branchiostoma lanceolatum]
MGKRNRTSGSSVSAEESSPTSTQRNPPPTKTPKMAEEAVGDRISSQIQCLDVKVDGLSSEVNTLRERVRELEKTAEFYSGELDTLRDALRDEQRERVKAVLLGERYSMKPDVIIRGIPYNKNEDSPGILARFLNEELHLADAMPVVAVHRLSRPTTTRPDPHLLARFVNYHDRDKVLAEGRKLRGNTRGLAVFEHLPPPLQTARSQLVPERDSEIAKAKDKNSKGNPADAENEYEDVGPSYEFPRNLLAIKDCLQEGDFGAVYKAEAWGIAGKTGASVVAVKTMNRVEEFLEELRLMKMVDNHPNIVRLLGCCTLEEPSYLILEYMSGGSLQSVLRTSRGQQSYENLHGGSKSLPSQDLIKFALDVAKGMSFLSAKKVPTK